MQLPLLADRLGDLALELTDPKLNESRRVAAGDALLNEFHTGQFKFDELAMLSDSLALGMKLLKNLKRYPPRPNDFNFRDPALDRLAKVQSAIGECLEKMSWRTTTQDETDLVNELLDQQGFNESFGAACELYRQYQLDQLVEQTEMLAVNMQNIAEAGDDMISGQTIKLDIPLYLLAQFFRAVGWRLEQLVEFSLPPLN
ncbi:MAG: hypothetical protein V1738_06370 [Patescibacteria group bacterium]